MIERGDTPRSDRSGVPRDYARPARGDCMEIEFDDEGGYVDSSMGLDTSTTLKVFCAEPGQVRISITSRASHGEMGLGVGLNAEQARSVGEHLIAQAKVLEDDEEE